MAYQSFACGLDQLQQHSQLGAMGVAELKTKKPRTMAGFSV